MFWIFGHSKLLINILLVVNSYMFPALSVDAVSRLLVPQDSSHSIKAHKSWY